MNPEDLDNDSLLDLFDSLVCCTNYCPMGREHCTNDKDPFELAVQVRNEIRDRMRHETN